MAGHAQHERSWLSLLVGESQGYSLHSLTFPREALVQVRTFDHEQGDLHFTARVVGPSSASHLRVRADDGLVFIVPAADCRLQEWSGQ